MRDAGAIAEAWFERVVEGYPEPTGQLMRSQADPFRNPVGAAFRQALPVLARHVIEAEAGPQDVRQALDSLLRIRAVQDLSAREAVGFVLQLREVLGSPAPEVQRRIDELALEAFAVYMECREQIAQIRARESVRARGVR